jgi:tetratricopeptide (TPR) repeat protein
VALKTLGEAWSRAPDARERLLREARAAAGLNHANIAAIYDVVEARDALHIVMEYVEGESLAVRLTAGRLGADDVTSIALQLCDGMAAAHAQGVIHRDLKPANVRLTPEGKIKILDFGLAKTLGTGGSLAASSLDSTPSRPEHLQGTPAYMSPEQLRGQGVDARTDIYSLGVLLYELLTGRRPFQGATVMELGTAILTEPTPAPAQADAATPPGLSAIVARAMARDREERFQSVVEMREALRRLPPSVSDRTTVSALFPWAIPPAVRRTRRSTRALWVVAVLAALATGLWLWGYRWPPPSSAFADRDWLLVGDVENGAGEPVFEDSLREGLVTALDQSSYVNVLPRERVVAALARMRRGPSTRIDATVGREICQREGVKALLLANLRRSGAAFQVSVQVLEAATGRSFFTEREQFTDKEQAFGKIDALARRVRENLGEPLARIARASRPLAQATTRSLEALQLYSKAREASARGDVPMAQGLLVKALEIDPDFAMAHFLLGNLASRLGDVAMTTTHWTRAYELREELSDRERPLVVASWQKLRGDYEKAVETLRLLTEIYPDDLDGRRELALALDAAGESARAVEELREVVRLDPYDLRSYGNLGLFLVTAGDFEGAAAIYDEAGRRALSSPYFGWGQGLSKLGLGDVEGALSEFRALEKAAPPFESLGRLYAARTAIHEGHFAEAHEELATGFRAERALGKGRFLALGRILSARLFWLEGRRAEARRELEDVLVAGKETEEDVLGDAGQLLAEMGDLGRARVVLRWLESGDGIPPTPFRKSYMHNLQAEIALAEGQADRAIEIFQRGAEDYPQYTSHLGLARAYGVRGDWRRAAEERRKVLEARGEILRFGFPADWALGHLELARVERRLGDETAAAEHYRAFLDLWKDAPDLPLRQRAVREWGQGADKGALEKRKEGV